MAQLIRYLSHPQVIVDPVTDVQKWSLNDVGQRRVHALAQSGALIGTSVVISSDETKATQTAEPLVNALGCQLIVRPNMHENDRSSTGFLPPKEFEKVADQFFANPDESVLGWETAKAAQERIVKEFELGLSLACERDVLFVGHGGVGTLLYCQLRGVPISRKYDQLPGGGCYYEFTRGSHQDVTGWRPMEQLLNEASL